MTAVRDCSATASYREPTGTGSIILQEKHDPLVPGRSPATNGIELLVLFMFIIIIIIFSSFSPASTRVKRGSCQPARPAGCSPSGSLPRLPFHRHAFRHHHHPDIMESWTAIDLFL